MISDFTPPDEKGLDADKTLLQTYETAFRQIYDVTGVEDIDIVVSNFIKKEDENFALFNYVNELNSEVQCTFRVAVVLPSHNVS